MKNLFLLSSLMFLVLVFMPSCGLQSDESHPNGSNNFTITTSTLSAGTYYLMVKHVTSSASGSYGITFQKIS